MYGLKNDISKQLRKTNITIFKETLEHRMNEYVNIIKFDHDFNVVPIDFECNIIYSSYLPLLRIKNVENEKTPFIVLLFLP